MNTQHPTPNGQHPTPNAQAHPLDRGIALLKEYAQPDRYLPVDWDAEIARYEAKIAECRENKRQMSQQQSEFLRAAGVLETIRDADIAVREGIR